MIIKDIICPQCGVGNHVKDKPIKCKNCNHKAEQIELKPCPFCGNEIIDFFSGQFHCRGCKAVGPDYEGMGYDYQEMVSSKWNRRS